MTDTTIATGARKPFARRLSSTTDHPVRNGGPITLFARKGFAGFDVVGPCLVQRADDRSKHITVPGPMIAPHGLTARRRLDFTSQGPRIGTGSAHLVGICGSGMKALAELLIGLGWKVSGSDLRDLSSLNRTMRERGVRIHSGHDDSFLPRDVDLVVHSPAVGPNNPELRMATRLGIPQMSYSQMLGQLMQSRVGVAIAGTHGKSTTAAMTATILSGERLSASAVFGAELCDSGASGWAGAGEILVTESCEYQRSFLDMRPRFAAILGIEPDHFDCYKNFAEVKAAFAEFCARRRRRRRAAHSRRLCRVGRGGANRLLPKSLRSRTRPKQTPTGGPRTSVPAPTESASAFSFGAIISPRSACEFAVGTTC